MDLFNTPHGGELINRILVGDERKKELAKAEKYTKLSLDLIEMNDLELIATGAYSPLTGFMGQEDYLSVLKRNYLNNGVLWTVPITLKVPAKTANNIKINNWIALTEKDGKILATMHVTDLFELDKELEIQLLYQAKRVRQAEMEHLYQNREIAIGGDIFLLNRPGYVKASPFRLDPAGVRQKFDDLGWKRIVSFQSPNPISHSQDSIEKFALDIVDGLLWLPQLGEAKIGKLMLKKKLEYQQEMIEYYYPPERIVLNYLPWISRQAGPREAVLEALVRKNYGCTHYIVAEKQYRIYNFYNIMDFRRIFEEIPVDDLGITPIFAEETFYCRKCGKVVTAQICPHDRFFNEMLNPVLPNEMLSKGDIPPLEFSGEGILPLIANKFWNENSSDAPVPGESIYELNPKLQRLIDNC